MCDKEQVVYRIMAATEQSQVSVFREPILRKYKTVFTNTVATQQAIKSNKANYLGSFYERKGKLEFEMLSNKYQD